MAGQYQAFNSSLTSENITNISSSSTLSAKNLYTYGERITVASLWACISLLGITGNTLVVLAVLLSRKLRTTTNVFVVNLAIADFLTSIFLTGSVVALLGKDGWPIPKAEWLCPAGGFMIFLCTGVSLYNLAAIALHRFVLITQPYETYRKIYTPINIAFVAALIWIIPVTIFISLPLAGIGGFGYDKHHYTCSDLDHRPKNKIFQLAQTIMFYPVPLITIVLSYVFVFLHMKRHFRLQRMHELSEQKTASSLSNISSHSVSVITNTTTDSQNLHDQKSSPKHDTEPTTRSKRIDELEVEITKNLFLVVCSFFLFFSPYCIALFITGSDYLLLYLGTCILANSTINPVIYWRRHPQFKVVLMLMMRCRYAEIPEPSEILKRFLSHT
ncbi:5-hydroxytryptamine receptor 1F-like [Amphiura filiformis]|uniref:5-hydroxytryptamine receptor 1F-like n=1 Tax=Amphiura filiformis TaxID=82378 RepID=UPI003B2187B3